ncbi:MAG: sodium:solute symporter family protein [Candidatus Methylomirabilia bacterium]
MAEQRSSAFLDNLGRSYGMYTGVFIAFVILLGIAEKMGLPPRIIGYLFIGVTIGVYALIGIVSRSTKISEYYVAGRSVPSVFNGMATGSDWMSAASIIGMAGTIYGMGYDGLAYIMGWTGGYVLLAVFLGPYLRKFGQYTIPDFLGARYGGNIPRLIGVVAAITVSFTYLLAQVTGVGIIASRFLDVDFAVGVFVGLGGILVCSLLGGMKAITWTQVAQYLILIIAYLTPVTILSYRHTGVPLPQLMYGQILQRIDARERKIGADPAEIQVQGKWAEQAVVLGERLQDPRTPAAEREKLVAARKSAVAAARPTESYLHPFARMDRPNMLALMFCLMVGTAGLPHILMRYYTVPSVKDARSSVGWSLFFICLLFFTAPAYAAFARWEVLSSLIGSKIAELPVWTASWAKVGLVAITDMNMDGILQLSELAIGADAVMLATPEIAGLPYVISGLVAAGGLAAALSTADGLLLTISTSLSHDLYHKVLNPNASIIRRLTISRTILVITAALAAWVATYKLTIIVEFVAWAFSIAAASFFPALVMGVWDKRANKAGAIAGMTLGFCLTLFYMVGSRFYGLNWFGIMTVSSGIFGIPIGLLTIYLVSRMTKAPSQELQDFVENVRYPRGAVGASDNAE